MARRIVIASQKGGVGKTTLALNLAVALAERGRRVLLSDLDSQGGIGLALAKADAELPGLAELLAGVARPNQVVLETQLPGLRLLARGRLDPTDVPSWERELHQSGRLGALLSSAEGDADVTVLDTPSGLGMVTTAALAAGDVVIVPFQTESLSLRSIGQVIRVVEHIQATENPGLRLLGIVPTMVEKRSAESLHALGEIWNGFPAAFETIVPRSAVYAQASAAGVPVVFLAGPTAPEARRFALLAEEIEARMIPLFGATHEATEPRQLL